MPGWVEHAIWWQVHPLGFLGAEPAARPADGPVEHRLPRLAGWLGYLLELGGNGLALGPVFAAGTHGYDTVDHFRVDARLGDTEDLRKLVGQCRERGVRVLLDGVFNHVGRDFGPFRDVLEHGRASAYADWFRIDWDADGPDGFGYTDFEGHRHLVALDHDSPAVADHVAGVLRHWLELGVDGWRLDAAYAVPPRFWRTVLDQVRPAYPEAWFVGEVLHGDYPAYVADSGLDSVTQYELWKATWSALNDRNLFELAHALERHDGFARSFLPQTFLGNHDVTRLASRLTDERHLAHALVVLATVPGVPTVYYGDEQAFRGVKEDRAGGDDAVRPAFPAGPAGLAPWGEPALRLHQELLGLRRRHPWLTRARVSVQTLTNDTLLYRSAADGHELLVALNVGDEDFPLPGSRTAEYGGTGDGVLAPHSAAVLG